MPPAALRRTLCRAFFFTEVVDMATTSAPADGAVARATSIVRTPIAVLVITSVVLVLGVLTVGAVLEAQAARSNAGFDYVAIVAYASCAALTAALGLLGVALFSSARTRVQRLFRAHIVVAGIAAATATANLLAMQVSDWTTTISCDGCDAGVSMAPTANQIAASVVVDLGAGALAALLPAIALLLLRNRRETAAQV